MTKTTILLLATLLSSCGTIQMGIVCINTPSGVKVSTKDDVEVVAEVDKINTSVELNGSKITKKEVKKCQTTPK